MILCLIPVLLIGVLFAIIYPHYNAFADSANSDEVDNTDKEADDQVKCDDNEELKNGECVPIKCDDNEELKNGECVTN